MTYDFINLLRVRDFFSYSAREIFWRTHIGIERKLVNFEVCVYVRVVLLFSTAVVVSAVFRNEIAFPPPLDHVLETSNSTFTRITIQLSLVTLLPLLHFLFLALAFVFSYASKQRTLSAIYFTMYYGMH